jgi:hypothetical protein
VGAYFAYELGHGGWGRPMAGVWVCDVSFEEIGASMSRRTGRERGR